MYRDPLKTQQRDFGTMNNSHQSPARGWGSASSRHDQVKYFRLESTVQVAHGRSLGREVLFSFFKDRCSVPVPC